MQSGIVMNQQRQENNARYLTHSIRENSELNAKLVEIVSRYKLA